VFLDRSIAVFRKAKAYRTLCSLVLISISMPAASDVLRGNCGNPDPDISIAGCTKKIQSDTADLQSGRGNMQAAAANLAGNEKCSMSSRQASFSEGKSQPPIVCLYENTLLAA
jgi:hypothetical protein